MQITITIPDSQWQEFQQVAQEAVTQSWNGSYEEFITYIMTVNVGSYIESQKRKQEKKMKKALASYEESLKQEQGIPVAKGSAVEVALAKTPVAKPQPTPSSPKPVQKPLPNKAGDDAMSNKALAERIAQLEEIPFRERTMVQAQELNDLLILRKKRIRGKKK